jgi:hypothetical protein
MNDEVKRLWVDALRSGEYKQGQGGLAQLTIQDEIVYCCLGVLCEVAIKSGLPLVKDDSENIVGYNNREAMPPNEVLIWASLEDKDACDLADMNDNEGWPFERIASFIEEKL